MNKVNLSNFKSVRESNEAKVIKADDFIKFSLDWHWPGSGIVTEVRPKTVWVRLVEPCKDFAIGEEVIITYDEIID